jgi:ParB/RepB/Spo0J family partition protein
MTTPTVTVTSRFLRLDQLVMPPRPLRGSIEEAGIVALAESIRKVGQLEPILVREVERDRYEIVAGQRRALAIARTGGLVEAKVAPYGTDVAVAENLGREALTPMEEARAYQRLVEEGLDAQEIAARVGRSHAHVAGRIRLASLDADTLALLTAGRIGYREAGLLAGVSADVRAKAVARMSTGRFVERWDYADVLDCIEEVAHELSDAPFDTTDENLMPAVGSCLRCPLNTGVQRDLFEARTATCLGVPCFKEKARRSAEVTRADAIEKGRLVLDGEEGERAARSGFTRLTSTCHEWARAHPPAEGELAARALTWGDVLTRSGREDIVPVLVIHDEAGVMRVTPMLRDRDKLRLLAGVDEAAGDEARADADVEDPSAKAKAEAAELRRKEIVDGTFRRLCEIAAEPLLDDASTIVLAARALASVSSSRVVEALCLRREWAKKGADAHHAIDVALLRRDPATAAGVIFELVLVTEREDALAKPHAGSLVHDLLDALEIDVAAVKGEVKRDLAKRDDDEAAKRGEGRVRKRRAKKSETVVPESAPESAETGATQ